MSDLITVICTVKNGENTISQTIESVLNQSYCNWEMVIVDDGSTDNTTYLLNSYEKEDNRIKVYYSGGIGRGHALNKAIDLSKGEYIANIDADDLMHPQRLECQINVINSHSVFLVSTKSELIYENETPNWQEINIKDIKTKQIDKNLLVRNQINHSSVLINKADLCNIGKYDEKRKSQFDYELWLRSFLSNKRMLVINSKLTAKRIHGNQSYENKMRLRYTLNSLLLQLKYLIRSRRYIYLVPLPITSFIMSQLPFKLRRKIVKNIFGES